jgi:hypothetical protein
MRQRCDRATRVVVRQPRDRIRSRDGTERELTVCMTRLEDIATRQRRTRVRDAAFAALVLLAGIVSITSVTTAVHAASAAHIAHR